MQFQKYPNPLYQNTFIRKFFSGGGGLRNQKFEGTMRFNWNFWRFEEGSGGGGAKLKTYREDIWYFYQSRTAHWSLRLGNDVGLALISIDFHP